jgi:hypothetical protein
MHGASVVALVIYDMLKPIDPAVEIGSIRLERKTGGTGLSERDNTPEAAAPLIGAWRRRWTPFFPMCCIYLRYGMGQDIKKRDQYGLSSGVYPV